MKLIYNDRIKKFAVLFLLFLVACIPKPEPDISNIRNLYLPSVFNRPFFFNTYISDGGIKNLGSDLSRHRLGYVRIGFGSEADPWDTPYQHYLNGGWLAVDQEVAYDINGIRNIGGIPVVMMTYGGPCQKIPIENLLDYADFVADFADKYSVKYIEPWNESDATYHLGGLPSLFGCGPDKEDMIQIIERVKAGTHSNVGSSFMMNQPEMMEYAQAVGSVSDWVGVHYYADYNCTTGEIFYLWPHSVRAAVDIVAQLTGKVPWITEVNLRDRTYQCDDKIFRPIQADFLFDALEIETNVFPFQYTNPPGWFKTGLHNSIFEQRLLSMYPLNKASLRDIPFD